MSKQSEAKLTQGFTKDAPMCSNCSHFKFDEIKEKKQWSSQEWTIQKNLRCSIGGFKVNKTNYCNLHSRIEKTES